MVLFLVEDSKPLRKIRLNKCCVILIIGEYSFKVINHSELKELGKNLVKEVKNKDGRYDGVR